MKQIFLDKLNEWYGSTIHRYEILEITEYDVLLFVAFIEKSSNKLIFEIIRIFMVGDSIQINIDETADDGFNMNSVLRLIKSAIKAVC